MAAHTYSAVRRRNVSPVSTILKVQTRDVDCSALTDSPEDGQIITAFGTNPFASTFSDVGAPTATDAMGSNLVMVWGSAQHSDRQALGDTRVPTFAHGGVEVQCKLFNGDDAVVLPTTYPLGTLVTAAACSSAVEGSAIGERLVIGPVTDGHLGWAIGYVTGASSTAIPVDGDYVQVYLYDKPRKIGSF